MFKNTAFVLCLALVPLTLPSCVLFTENVQVETVQVRTSKFLPIATDVCRYVQVKAPDRDVSDLLEILSIPEREITVSRLTPMLDWVLPLYVSLIDSDPALSFNAKDGRKLSARALETTLNRILER